MPENIDDTSVHGTSIGAIRPIWLGEARQRSEYGRDYRHMKSEEKSRDDRDKTKGIFRIKGNNSVLGRGGFKDLTADGRHIKNLEPSAPIYLVFSFKGYGAHNTLAYGLGEKICAIVLTGFDWKSATGKITKFNDTLQKLRAGEITPGDVSWPQSEIIPDELSNQLQQEWIGECERTLSWVKREKPRQFFDEYTEYLKKRIGSGKLNERDTEDAAHVLKTAEEVLQGSRHIDYLILSSSLKNYIYRFERRKQFMNEHLTSEQIEGCILERIKRLERLRQRAGGKEIFDASGLGAEEGLFLTHEQCANYIAHCMVQGIDKSKIVPIYDWDGNLLWPKD